MYIWKKLRPEQQKELLEYRTQQHQPWHSPPTLFYDGKFHLSAACYEHAHHIGRELERMADFSRRLIETITETGAMVFAWCVLPNHYHLLIETSDLKSLKREVGQLHGRTSREWNLAEESVGRTVWHNCADRAIRNERHYWATVNYIHNNPILHGYVGRWTDWPFSSAHAYLEAIGREKAEAIWRKFPVLDYGQGWDNPEF